MANDYDIRGRNIGVDAILAQVTRLALHIGDPGAADTAANEASGGSPAYARKAIAFNAAAGGSATPTTDTVFDVPAGTYNWVSGWNTAGTQRFFKKAITAEVFAGQGTHTVKADTTFDLNDA